MQMFRGSAGMISGCNKHRSKDANEAQDARATTNDLKRRRTIRYPG